MLLKEMRNLHFQKHPEISYAPEGFNFGFLDNRNDETLSTISDLDKYI